MWLLQRPTALAVMVGYTSRLNIYGADLANCAALPQECMCTVRASYNSWARYSTIRRGVGFAGDWPCRALPRCVLIAQLYSLKYMRANYFNFAVIASREGVLHRLVRGARAFLPMYVRAFSRRSPCVILYSQTSEGAPLGGRLCFFAASCTAGILLGSPWFSVWSSVGGGARSPLRLERGQTCVCRRFAPSGGTPRSCAYVHVY